MGARGNGGSPARSVSHGRTAKGASLSAPGNSRARRSSQPCTPRACRRASSEYETAASWAAFDYAFQGILYATRTQRNMRIHLVAASLAMFRRAVPASRARVRRARRPSAIALVIALELVNTAIEAVVDLMDGRASPAREDRKRTRPPGGRPRDVDGRRHRRLPRVLRRRPRPRVPRSPPAVAGHSAELRFSSCSSSSASARSSRRRFAGNRGSPLQGGGDLRTRGPSRSQGATVIGFLSGTLVVALLAFFLAFLVFAEPGRGRHPLAGGSGVRGGFSGRS